MYDPSTKANITWSGNIFGAMYVLFELNCHIVRYSMW